MRHANRISKLATKPIFSLSQSMIELMASKPRTATFSAFSRSPFFYAAFDGAVGLELTLNPSCWVNRTFVAASAAEMVRPENILGCSISWPCQRSSLPSSGKTLSASWWVRGSTTKPNGGEAVAGQGGLVLLHVDRSSRSCCRNPAIARAGRCRWARLQQQIAYGDQAARADDMLTAERA